MKAMIDSIINQTYRDWELILVDDASDDGTWEIIEEIKDKRIVKVRNLTNIGLTKNLNTALRLARGKYIIRMDADDIAIANRIERQVEFMEANSDVVLSGCWMQCFGESHNIIKTYLSDKDIRIDLIFNSPIMHPTFIIRGEVVEKHKVKYCESLKYAQDYEFVYQMAKFGKLSNIPEILVKYRTHGDQVSSAHLVQQRICADTTRKKIIKDMEINLNDHEFKLWSDFCIGNRVECTDEEKSILSKIIEYMIKGNRLKHTYDEQKLERALTEKMQVVTVLDKENIKNPISEAEKYKRLFYMMSRWMKLKQNGNGLIEWFMVRSYQSIAVYGMGDVGECLVGELRDSPVKIEYGIDQNRVVRCSLKGVVSLDDKLEEVDVIIITAIFYTDEIKRMLAEKISCPVVSIEDIIYDIILPQNNCRE